MKSYTLIKLYNKPMIGRSTVPLSKNYQPQLGKIHRSTDGYYAFLPPGSPESEVDKVTQIMINCAISTTITQLKTLSDRLESLKALRSQNQTKPEETQNEKVL